MEDSGLAVIIPAENQADTIGGQVSELSAGVPPEQVIVVNDASEDEKAERAVEAGVHVNAKPTAYQMWCSPIAGHTAHATSSNN